MPDWPLAAFALLRFLPCSSALWSNGSGTGSCPTSLVSNRSPIGKPLDFSSSVGCYLAALVIMDEVITGKERVSGTIIRSIGNTTVISGMRREMRPPMILSERPKQRPLRKIMTIREATEVIYDLGCFALFVDN